MAGSVAWPLRAKVCGRLRTRTLRSAQHLGQYSRSRSDRENSLGAYRNRSGLSDCAALHAPLRGAQRLQQYLRSIRQFERAQLKQSAMRDKGLDARHQSSCAMAVRSFLRASADRARPRVVRREAEQRPSRRGATPGTRRPTWAPAVAASSCISRTAAPVSSKATAASRQMLLGFWAKAVRHAEPRRGWRLLLVNMAADCLWASFWDCREPGWERIESEHCSAAIPARPWPRGARKDLDTQN